MIRSIRTGGSAGWRSRSRPGARTGQGCRWCSEGCRGRPGSGMKRARPTAPSATTAISHLTCCRWIWSPCRKRVTTAIAAPPNPSRIVTRMNGSSTPRMGSRISRPGDHRVRAHVADISDRFDGPDGHARDRAPDDPAVSRRRQSTVGEEERDADERDDDGVDEDGVPDGHRQGGGRPGRMGTLTKHAVGAQGDGSHQRGPRREPPAVPRRDWPAPG